MKSERELQLRVDTLAEVIENRQRKGEDAGDYIDQWWKERKELEELLYNKNK